ncbi:hypothetical protein [Mesorhizobium sp. B1-1-8]|uniref:hypothetical protein n=1 Tax=Mesorhizobium sp. B1-1-8 TaxID=2589976 RepID=UPI00112AF81C|nr:hypothetical protein [Mesorhizobium sp. B1-1-8]UCI07382.1 hypothetical protein FJ974_26965 [Mesorhizobium sp. B1-1-8]
MMTEMENSNLHELRVRFEGLSVADANKRSKELERLLAPSVGPSGSIQIARDSDVTQDLGATLILVLGTPAAFAIAKGLHNFISKWGDRVIIETKNGKVIATGDGAKNIDVAKTMAAIQEEK